MRSSPTVSFFLLFLFVCSGSCCFGASIDVAPVDGGEKGLVTITGPLEYSDIEQFQTKTSGLTQALVMFSSDGGNLEAGIQIGRMMRLKGFLSLVPDGARCASACALAWLGGSKRLMGATGQVGFHAAYVLKDGVASTTSGGNALVGAYLNQIGLPDRAVLYITTPSPDEIAWLKLEDAESLGIDVGLFTPEKTTTSAPSVPTRTLPATGGDNASARYRRTNCGSIIDGKTGIEWYIGPDSDLSWTTANLWVQEFGACGKRWEMPTAKELRSLFDPRFVAGTGYFTSGRYWPAHIEPVFSGIGRGSWVWVQGSTFGGNAPAFNFNQGLAVQVSANHFYGTVRVFAVAR